MIHSTDFLAPRTCLRAPLPEHETAADLLSAAADAISSGDLGLARDRLREADMPALLQFAKRLMGPETSEIQRRRRVPQSGPAAVKASSRMPTSAEIRALHVRDGWRCRFCGCRVVSGRARSAMRACMPGAISWGTAKGYHGAFYALTATVDHVLPHSAGGGNELQNLVTACWPCQFGRGAYTIEELGLSDPRLRPPVVEGWDGLCRVIGQASAADVDQADAVERSSRVLRPSKAEWLAALDGIHPGASDRLIGFLDGCGDIDVSWSLNKVLLARMKAGNSTIAFMAVEPTGEVHLPWWIDGRKALFRSFAETLAASIPDAIVYETAKLWKVTKTDRTHVDVAQLLDSSAAIRTALVSLSAAMKAPAASP